MTGSAWRASAPRSRSARVWAAVGLAAGLVLALLVAFRLEVRTQASSVPSPPPGWAPVFVDTFTGPAGSGPGPAWITDTGSRYQGPGCPGRWGTGEVESDTAAAANLSQDGHGHLDITPVSSGGAWTSARIETASDSFTAPPGGKLMITASIRQPAPATGLGYWPAFWLLGASFRSSGGGTAGTMACPNWPSAGVIAVMEGVNGLPEVAGALQCGSSPGRPCHEAGGVGSGFRSCSGCLAGFRTYTVVIDRSNPDDESVTWYLNGTAYYRDTEAEMGTAAWQTAVDHGFFLVIDVAIGGGFPDGVCHCTAPASTTTPGAPMSVGYVAVYRSGGR